MKSFTSSHQKLNELHFPTILKGGILSFTLLLFLILLSAELKADVFQSTGNGTGAWNASASWSKSSGSSTRTFPTALDEATILPGHYLNVPANTTAECLKLTIGELKKDDCKLTLNSGSVLKVSGLLSVFASKNGKFNELAIGPGLAEIGSVDMWAESNSRTAKLSVGTGTLKIFGNFQMDLANGNSSKYSFLQISNDASENGNGTQTGRAELGGYIVLTQQNTTDPQKEVFDLDPTSTVVFNGQSIVQQIPTLVRFGKVIVANSTGVRPKADLSSSGTSGCIVRNTLEVNGGLLLIENALNLTGMTVMNSTGTIRVKSTGSLTGYSKLNYINQSAGSTLIIENIGPGARTGEVIFPVGTDTYNPVYIDNSKTGNTVNAFSVGVVNGVQYNGVGLEANAVNKTWNIDCVNKTGTVDITLKLQWNQANQMSGFNNLKCSIRHYTNNRWNQALDATNGDRAAFVVSGPINDPNAVYSITRSGITSFSPFAVGDNLSPLPVEMVSFKAIKRDANVQLEWETASEKNNAGFEIQTSGDGRKFETIATVASKNSNANYHQKYDFLDKTTRSGLIYYRLKQTDFDGTVAYYAAKVVDMGKASDVVMAYPNPFRNQFEVKIASSSDQKIELMVTDLTGKIVFQSNEPIATGNNILKVQLQNYPAGVYLLTSRTADQTFNTRLVKQ